MNSIIDHLFKDLNYGKYAGTKRLSKENTMARNNLRKIAAAVLMQGKDFSEDEYYQFIDGEINNDKETLIKLSDVFVRDIDGKCHFTHNNFKEFLAAEFFNEKYSNDLDGLLKVIAYSDQNGIRKKYLNMVSFLLSIRTHDDLLNWIAERCPENYYLFEKDKLSQDKRNMVFFRLFEDSVHKAYYLGYDYQGEIGSLVDNDEAVSYLLDQIRQSDDEMVLFNALRTLQKAHNIPTECLNEIKDTIIWFLDNEKGTDNHARDAIEVINELRLFTQKVTTYFFEKYHKSDNLEIRRGLYRYIYRNDISDLFAPFLVKGLGLKSRFEMLSLTLYYDICKFKCKQSFIVFFEFVIRSSDEYSIKSYYDHVISNDEFVENLINSYLAYKDEDYLNLIIETSCCFAENGYLRFNAFNSFFSKTNTENKAIDCYFIKFKEMPVVFYFLAGQFANYVDFLRKGYVSGKFSDCRLLFDYCVREFDKDSDERKSFTSLISDTKYSDADESLQYITISDNVNRNTNTKKLLFSTFPVHKTIQTE